MDNFIPAYFSSIQTILNLAVLHYKLIFNTDAMTVLRKLSFRPKHDDQSYKLSEFIFITQK